MLTQNNRLGIGCARCNAPKRVRPARLNSASAALCGNQVRVALETLAFQVRPKAIALYPVSSLSVDSSSKPRPPEYRAFSEMYHVLIAYTRTFGARDTFSPRTLPAQSRNDPGRKRIKEPLIKSSASARELIRSSLTIAVRLKENTAGNPAVIKPILRRSNNGQL